MKREDTITKDISFVRASKNAGEGDGTCIASNVSAGDHNTSDVKVGGAKLWGGRFDKQTDARVEEFTSSIRTDVKLWRADLNASIAHARMLGNQNIIPAVDAEKIIEGLQEIKAEIQNGKFEFNPLSEDLHSEIESRLFLKIGEAAKKLHTARSRNDQVVTDTRLYLLEEVKQVLQLILDLKKQLLATAEKHIETVMPGLTHFQHAQPISLAHHLMAYFWMLDRDHGRLSDSIKRISSLPLGSAALAGTGFPIDRRQTQNELGFQKISENSLDAVSDRDFVIEFLSDASIIMMHLSRLSEELIIWSSTEFGFIQLADEVTTGSSIMPQKKNPDVAELIRGRVGRVYGALMGALTMMKGLPLAYNRDMQEDKIHLFEGLETVKSCLEMMTIMLQNATWNTEKMNSVLAGDFSNATDLADDLVEKGVSFREAHEVVGRIIQNCLKQGFQLENLSIEELKKGCSLLDEKSKSRLNHQTVMEARTSEGGTAPQSVKDQIKKAHRTL